MRNQGMFGSAGQVGFSSPGGAAFRAPTTIMSMRMGKPRTYNTPIPRIFLCSLSVKNPAQRWPHDSHAILSEFIDYNYWITEELPKYLV